MTRYSSAIPPRASSSSRSIVRQTKSKARQLRASSVIRPSCERYVPNSASEEYEQLLNETRRAKSMAANQSTQLRAGSTTERRKNRQLRAMSGKYLVKLSKNII